MDNVSGGELESAVANLSPCRVIDGKLHRKYQFRDVTLLLDDTARKLQ